MGGTISIHALRVEGDQTVEPVSVEYFVFLSTPSGWRATATAFILATTEKFLSTPSGWRATIITLAYGAEKILSSIHALRVEGDLRRALPKACPPTISIHALRVEGDSVKKVAPNARLRFLSTPSGWRATPRGCPPEKCDRFLSTPSGWRATRTSLWTKCRTQQFLSTPSGWRATRQSVFVSSSIRISIHALRVEGDCKDIAVFERRRNFYPRPPGGGRLYAAYLYRRRREISIHALRVEGDIPSR